MTDYDVHTHIREMMSRLSKGAHELAHICELELSGIRDGNGFWDPPEVGTHGLAEDVVGDAMGYVSRLIERIERALTVAEDIAEAKVAKALSRQPQVREPWTGPA